MTALLHTCADDPSPDGARNAAIIVSLRGTGLRGAEVAILNLTDYDPDNGRITVQRSKARQDRIIYTPTEARAAVA